MLKFTDDTKLIANSCSFPDVENSKGRLQNSIKTVSRLADAL